MNTIVYCLKYLGQILTHFILNFIIILFVSAITPDKRQRTSFFNAISYKKITKILQLSIFFLCVFHPVSIILYPTLSAIAASEQKKSNNNIAIADIIYHSCA